MAVRFPPLEGERLTTFLADLDKRGSQTVELWSSTSSVDRIVRWPVEGEVERYGEAVANRIVAVEREEISSERVRRAIEEASDQTITLVKVGEGYRIFTFDDAPHFWPRFRDLQERLQDISHLEPDYLTRIPLPDPGRASAAMLDELAMIGARNRWPPGLETSAALVAVLDTGIDLEHPVLCSRYIVDKRSNLVAPGQLPADDDGGSHGTYCSGLIAGDSSRKHFKPDSAGFGGGILRKGRIFPIKTHDSQGICPTTRAADAITLASRDLGAKVLCAPWTTANESRHLQDSIAAAEGRGCLLVTAAGNDPLDLDNGGRVYPASFDLRNIVVVGGVGDQFAPVEKWGFGTTSVDLSAPGETIQGPERNRGFQSLSGTSASTAIVAGAAALVQEAARHYLKRFLSPAELKDTLLQSVRPIDPAHPKRTCTGGFLYISNAVGLVAGSFQPPVKLPCS